MADMRKHWYFITSYLCPQCGGSDTLRERRYTRRPLLAKNRHEYIEEWDYCD